jgi:hypothetical protein
LTKNKKNGVGPVADLREHRTRYSLDGFFKVRELNRLCIPRRRGFAPFLKGPANPFAKCELVVLARPTRVAGLPLRLWAIDVKAARRFAEQQRRAPKGAAGDSA